MRTMRRIVFVALLLAAAAASARVKTLVVISIDGLKPEYLTQAEQHGLKLPHLRRFVERGTYAEGVVGVVPTVTYPSHTTLLTGVWPIEHGITNNTTFDPLRKNQEGWYWYASAIKAPTLWEAASRRGIVVASVNWPVSVDAPGVRYLIPEYWRARTPDDRGVMEALTRPLGMLQEMEKSLGPYIFAAKAVDTDAVRTHYAVALLRDKKPGLITIHLDSLDHEEHETGPFSASCREVLEAIDGMVGEIESTALKNDANAVVAIVSDHGFSATDRRINVMAPFIEAGLVTLGEPPKTGGQPPINSWDAIPWTASGSFFVMLRNREDAAVQAKTRDLLRRMQDDPRYGIGRVIAQPEVTKMGGDPSAAFLVEMKLNKQPAVWLNGLAAEEIPSSGTHGYLPDNPELRASFFVAGKGIAAGKNLDVVDMRQICPTLAELLGVPMPSAKQKPLNLH
jgi:predicted AlkP superfamily pyrophosphatase or phosphodiesterase